jgi:hypothetical protein
MKPSDLLQTNHGLYSSKDWEKELDERFDVEYPYIFEERNELKSFIRSQRSQLLKSDEETGGIIAVANLSKIISKARQDLLKELRGEVHKLQVKPMEEYLVTGYSDALDDVTKIIKKYE